MNNSGWKCFFGIALFCYRYFVPDGTEPGSFTRSRMMRPASGFSKKNVLKPEIQNTLLHKSRREILEDLWIIQVRQVKVEDTQPRTSRLYAFFFLFFLCALRVLCGERDPSTERSKNSKIKDSQIVRGKQGFFRTKPQHTGRGETSGERGKATRKGQASDFTTPFP